MNMIQPNFTHKILPIIVVLTFSISLILFEPTLAFAEKKTGINDERCKMFYSLYKEIGESKFQDRYYKNSKILDCLKLYKNQSWTFVGKGKVDKYFDSLNKQSKINEYSDIRFNILTKNAIGKMKYVIKFEACSSKTVPDPYFLILSDSDKYLASAKTYLQGNKCSAFRAEIHAKSTTSIRIEYASDLGKYENIKTKTIYLV